MTCLSTEQSVNDSANASAGILNDDLTTSEIVNEVLINVSSDSEELADQSEPSKSSVDPRPSDTGLKNLVFSEALSQNSGLSNG